MKYLPSVAAFIVMIPIASSAHTYMTEITSRPATNRI